MVTCPRRRRLIEQRVIHLDAARFCKSLQNEIVLGRKSPALAHLGNSGPGDAHRSCDGVCPEFGYGACDVHVWDHGQYVQRSQAKTAVSVLWPAWPRHVGHNTPMARQAKTAYRQDFLRRTREAREATGLARDDFAKLLGVPKEAYTKYETRSLLPHDLTAQFLLITGASYTWLFTGVGKPPARKEIGDLERSA